MTLEQKYLTEQKLFARYLLQNAPVTSVYEFLMKYPCPINPEKTLEINRRTLEPLHVKAKEKTIGSRELQNALKELNIPKEDVEEFLQRVAEAHPAKHGLKQRKAREAREKQKEEPEGEEEEEEEEGMASRIESMTPEERIYIQGRAGLDDLKKEKLIEELGDVGIKKQPINMIIKRWDSNPRIRSELGELYALLRLWVPKSFSNEVLLDILDVLGQVETEYGGMVERDAVPIFMDARRRESQPQFIEPPQRRGPREIREIGSEQPLAPRERRENPNISREPVYDDSRRYDYYPPEPRRENPNISRDPPGFAPNRLPPDQAQFFMQRIKDLEAKIEDKKLRPAGSTVPVMNPPAHTPPPETSSPYYKMYGDAQKRLEGRDKDIEELKEANRKREAELGELRAEKRDRDLIEKTGGMINQQLSHHTAEMDKRIGEMTSKIESMKSDLPKGMTAEDIVKLRQVTDPYALDMQKLEIQRQREERDDTRKASFYTDFGEFLKSMGGKGTQALLKTTGLIEEGSGEKHEVQSANPYEKQPELMVFPCPLCGENIHAGATTTRVQCPNPKCKSWFNKIPEGQAVFIPEPPAAAEPLVNPHPDTHANTQADIEKVEGAEGKGEGEGSEAKEGLETEKGGVEEEKKRGEGKGKGKEEEK